MNCFLTKCRHRSPAFPHPREPQAEELSEAILHPYVVYMHRAMEYLFYTSPLPLNKMLAAPYSPENIRQSLVLNEQLNLYMLFPVNSDSRSTELLSGSCLPLLLQQLKVFDFVILDTPPMGMFPDAEILADLVDASVLVVRQDYTSAYDINDAVDALNNSKSTFLGCVLNDMRSSGASQYGYGAKYGYGGRYGYGSRYRYGGHYAYSYHRSGSSSRDS